MRKFIYLAVCLLMSALQINAKSLVVYFSHTGNTRVVAKEISQATGADIFEIQPTTTYPTEKNACIAQCRRELDSKSYPKVKKMPALSKYDTIYLGSPNWLTHYAPVMLTFMKNANLAGKKVVLFCTYGGGKFGVMKEDVVKLAPKAKVMTDGLAVKGEKAKVAHNYIVKWLKSNNLIK